MPIFTDGVQKWARICISTLEIGALTAPIKRDKMHSTKTGGSLTPYG